MTPSRATTDQRLRQALDYVRILVGYGCIDQNPNTPPCGSCGPCEAAAFLRTHTPAGEIARTLPRFTTIELLALMHAVTLASAGEYDGWSSLEQEALERAEEKLRAQIRQRKDVAKAEARIEASPEIVGGSG